MLTPWEFFVDLTNPMLAFLPKAVLVAVLSSIVAGAVGCHVVLRGMSFIGDAVSHSVFPGLAVAFLLQGSLILGGLIAGLITSLLVAVFSQNRRLKEDSIIGVFFAAAFALGIVIISLAPGYSGSLQQFLFGSIAGVSDSDIIVVGVATVVVIAVLIGIHKELVAVSLDREMAKASRLPVFLLDIVLYTLVTVSVVIAVQTIGNILVLALLITPAATARMLTDRLWVMMVTAPILGAVSSFIGIYLSWSFNLPAGGAIVLVCSGIFLLVWLLAPKHGLAMRWLPKSSANKIVELESI